MMSGQRLHAETIAPFSTEMRSAGRPFEIILAVSASVMSTSIGSTPSVIGTLRSPRSSSQLPRHSARRLSLSNAPTYDTKPAASMQSPTSETDEPLSFSISLPQRSFSEERPPTSRSARPSRSMHAAASASTRAFSSVASFSLFSSFCSISSTTATLPCAVASDASAAALDALAASSESISGLTLT